MECRRKGETSGEVRQCFLIKVIFILCLASLLAVLILMILLTPALSVLEDARASQIDCETHRNKIKLGGDAILFAPNKLFQYGAEVRQNVATAYFHAG